MPLAGKGMLLTSMDIDPADEADFNRWYDREHLEERVAIDGFLEARRYVAHAGSPKYLCLYSTETFDVLDSPAYRTRLDNPDRLVEGDHGAFQEHDPRGRAHHGQPRHRPRRRARHRPVSSARGTRGCIADCTERTSSIPANRRHHLDASARERRETFAADGRHSGSAKCRRRRLVRADRRHQCQRRDRRCSRRASPALSAPDRSRFDLDQAFTIWCGISRRATFRGLNAAAIRVAKITHVALPHERSSTLTLWRCTDETGDHANLPLCIMLNGSNKVTL